MNVGNLKNIYSAQKKTTYMHEDYQIHAGILYITS